MAQRSAPPPRKPDPGTAYRILGILKAFPPKAVAYDLLKSYSAVKDILVPMPVMKEVVISMCDRFNECLVPAGKRYYCYYKYSDVQRAGAVEFSIRPQIWRKAGSLLWG